MCVLHSDIMHNLGHSDLVMCFTPYSPMLHNSIYKYNNIITQVDAL